MSTIELGNAAFVHRGSTRSKWALVVFCLGVSFLVFVSVIAYVGNHPGAVVASFGTAAILLVLVYGFIRPSEWCLYVTKEKTGCMFYNAASRSGAEIDSGNVLWHREMVTESIRKINLTGLDCVELTDVSGHTILIPETYTGKLRDFVSALQSINPDARLIIEGKESSVEKVKWNI